MLKQIVDDFIKRMRAAASVSADAIKRVRGHASKSNCEIFETTCRSGPRKEAADLSCLQRRAISRYLVTNTTSRLIEQYMLRNAPEECLNETINDDDHDQSRTTIDTLLPVASIQAYATQLEQWREPELVIDAWEQLVITTPESPNSMIENNDKDQDRDDFSLDFDIASEFASTTISSLVKRAENPEASPIELGRLASHESAEVRIAVADNAVTPHEVLEQLANDENPDVRFALAENHGAGTDILLILLEDSNPYVVHRAQQTLLRIDSGIVLYPQFSDYMGSGRDRRDESGQVDKA
jgi:hypothetical protein